MLIFPRGWRGCPFQPGIRTQDRAPISEPIHLEKSWTNLGYFSSLQQGSGGRGGIALIIALALALIIALALTVTPHPTSGVGGFQYCGIASWKPNISGAPKWFVEAPADLHVFEAFPLGFEWKSWRCRVWLGRRQGSSGKQNADQAKRSRRQARGDTGRGTSRETRQQRQRRQGLCRDLCSGAAFPLGNTSCFLLCRDFRG